MFKNIYITGDTHSKFNRFGSKVWFESRNFVKEENLVIILGDFAGIWCSDLNDPHWEEEKYWLEWLSNKNFYTAFVDGNHENFDRLEKLEQIETFNGTVGKVSDSIFHLKRGEVYTINNKKFFVMGGAMSIDKDRRIENVSWWSQEQPSKKEMDYGIDNLIKHDMKVDVVLTHTCPKYIVPVILDEPMDTLHHKKYSNYYHKFYDPLTKYLEYVKDSIQFENWFFGHFHEDKKIDDRFLAMYERIIKLHM